MAYKPLNPALVITTASLQPAGNKLSVHIRLYMDSRNVVLSPAGREFLLSMCNE
jgi:hypothetical protein